MRHSKEIEQFQDIKKDKEAQIARFERLLSDREYDVKQLAARNKNYEEEIKILNQKIDDQELSYIKEYDKKIEELKRMYSD